MGLENLKRKLEADRKAKETSPCTRTTIVVGKDGKPQFITEPISFEEWLADQEGYEDNPEDPEYRRMMEGEDW